MTDISFSLINEKLNGLVFDADLPRYKHKIISKLRLNEKIILGNQFFVVFDHQIKDIIYTHPNIKAILGFTAENISINDMLSLIFIEDKELVLNAAKSIMNAGLINQKHKPLDDVFCIEYRLYKIPDEIIWVRQEVTTLLKDNKGIPLLTLVQINDLSNDKGLKEFKTYYCGRNASEIKYPSGSPFTYKKTNCLTKRENEILLLIQDSMKNSEISKKLNIAITTVKKHRNNILKKTEQHNSFGLIKWAHKNM